MRYCQQDKAKASEKVDGDDGHREDKFNGDIVILLR